MNFNDMPKDELIKIEAQIKMEIFKRRLLAIRKTMNTQKFTFSQLIQDKVQVLEHVVSHELSTMKRIYFIEDKLDELEIILNIDN